MFIQIAGLFERSKYYAIWTLTEGASIVTGLGFTGYSPTGATLWEGAKNVDVKNIELPPNMKVLFDSWNMKTNIWLRECVYKRMAKKGKKPGFKASQITFATSAFWHGVAGGYYLAFILAGFATAAARLVRSNVRPLFLPVAGQPTTLAKRIYDVVSTAASVVMMNYFAIAFVLRDTPKALAAWTRLWWYGHVGVGALMVFFYFGGGIKYFRKLQQRRAQMPDSKGNANGLPPKPRAPPAREGSLPPTVPNLEEMIEMVDEELQSHQK